MAGVELRAYQEAMEGWGARPESVIVAPSLEAVNAWWGEPGFDKNWDFWTPTSSLRVRFNGHVWSSGLEFFFVGEWGQIPAWKLAELLRSVRTVKDFQATYVCDAWGEIIERPWMWAQWPAVSTGRMTAWHACQRGSWVALCGVSGETTPVAGHVSTVRWGPPRGACGACRIMVARKPVGTGDYQAAMRKKGEWNTHMLSTSMFTSRSAETARRVRGLAVEASKAFMSASASIQRLKAGGYLD